MSCEQMSLIIGLLLRDTYCYPYNSCTFMNSPSVSTMMYYFSVVTS
jgi:hypothetical protein